MGNSAVSGTLERREAPLLPPPVTRRLQPGKSALLAPPRSGTGLMAASLLLAASLVPSLLPRGWLMQGVLSGLAISIGYGAGAIVGALSRRYAARMLPAAVPAVVRWACWALGVGLVLWSLAVNLRWQTDVRQMMGVEAVGWYYTVALTGVALLTAALLVVLSRVIRRARHGYVQAIERLVPRRWRRLVRAVVTVTVVVATADVVMADWMVGAVRDTFATADARYEADVQQPTSLLRSGGPGSHLGWEELGRMGRAFTGTGPTMGDLTAFSGEPATPPIRVYVGLASAETADERAGLALAELERTRAFERDILLLATPTGTGWVDPAAIDPLEYLYNGDTAVVSVQYSYKPSWATMFGNQDQAKEGARALMDAVSRRLDEMPAAARPRLLLYGQSLGSFGSERLFTSVDDVTDRVDGALWAGPPSANPLWRELVAERESGSPVWQPVYQGGRTVRFGSDGNALSRPIRAWETPRIAYLQNATDPITWWSSHLLFQRPEWMNEPQGPGVSERMPFVPIVTCLQIALDFLQSTAVPPGYGHVFGPAHAEAWTLIAPPQDWSSTDTTKLLSVVASDIE